MKQSVEKKTGGAPRANRDYRKILQERFKRCSFQGFHSNEILEFLLLYAVPKKDVKHLAKTLMARFKGFRGVFDAEPEELMGVDGIGDNAVVLIKLLKDITGVYLKERINGQDIITCTRDVLDYLKLTLSGERVEKFLAIYMNGRNEVKAMEVLHEGTINQTVVYPRKAIEKAFKHNASSVIFVHNHPSGDATPSSVDWQLTRVLDRAALAVDLFVHDHIIIGKNSHFSARENGWIIGCTVNRQKAAESKDTR